VKEKVTLNSEDARKLSFPDANQDRFLSENLRRVWIEGQPDGNELAVISAVAGDQSRKAVN